MDYEIYLSLGSNLGDKMSNVRTAIKKLKKYIDISDISSFYESEPMGGVATELFINIVVKARTSLLPQRLLREINSIESSCGRKRSGTRWENREIDIDIVHYKGIIMNDYKLTLPHKEVFNRLFVVQPLLEIDENLEINGLKLNKHVNSLEKKQKFYIKKIEND